MGHNNMRWITRCPSCGLIYQLVPDQLKVAQGWLRCGQCQAAFDSTGLVVASPVGAHKTETPEAAAMDAGRLNIDDLLKQEDSSALQTPQAALLAHGAVPEDRLPALPPSSASWWPMVVVVILVLALALQWVGVERYRLVAAEPALAQPLQKLCRVLGCKMEPPPVRNGVVIESSSMTPRDGGLVLLWSVRNVTAQALEMPALELTWLDSQDKALVRRVLSPTEQVAPSALAAGQTWQGRLQLLPAEGVQPRGYRLVSFYP